MRRLRVVAHVHSAWSEDAGWPLADIVNVFSRMRVDAILMSEHDRGFTEARWISYQRACAAASTSRILVVPGIEYQDPDNVVHIPVWGRDVPFLGESRPTLDLLKAAREACAVAVFAHPTRRDAIGHYRHQWTPLLSGVEVWNRKYDGVAPNCRSRDLARQESLKPFVSLDFHTGRHLFPLFTTLEVEGPRSIASVVDALREGNFYPNLLGVAIDRFFDGPLSATVKRLERARQRLSRALRRPSRSPSR